MTRKGKKKVAAGTHQPRPRTVNHSHTRRGSSIQGIEAGFGQRDEEHERSIKKISKLLRGCAVGPQHEDDYFPAYGDVVYPRPHVPLQPQQHVHQFDDSVSLTPCDTSSVGTDFTSLTSTVLNANSRSQWSRQYSSSHRDDAVSRLFASGRDEKSKYKRREQTTHSVTKPKRLPSILRYSCSRGKSYKSDSGDSNSSHFTITPNCRHAGEESTIASEPSSWTMFSSDQAFVQYQQATANLWANPGTSNVVSKYKSQRPKSKIRTVAKALAQKQRNLSALNETRRQCQNQAFQNGNAQRKDTGPSPTTSGKSPSATPDDIGRLSTPHELERKVSWAPEVNETQSIRSMISTGTADDMSSVTSFDSRTFQTDDSNGTDLMGEFEDWYRAFDDLLLLSIFK